MNDKATAGVHWSFWVIGVLALIWNAMGAMNFVGQMMTGDLAAVPEFHRAIIEGRPAWATAGFAIAVFGGALGCILLLLRKSAATWMFIASLLGVIVQMIHSFGITINFGPAMIALTMVMPLAVALFLVWYAKQAQRRGWIG